MHAGGVSETQRFNIQVMELQEVVVWYRHATSDTDRLEMVAKDGFEFTSILETNGCFPS
jgi:hypothetical protein